MNTAVIICTRNNGHLIRDAIDTVLASDDGRFTLHIVDQSTNDITEELSSTYVAADHRVRYHRLDSVGLSRARNFGVRAAGDADLIIYTDDDTRVDRFWLRALREEFERDPDVAAIYGRVLPDGESLSGIYLAIKDDPVRAEWTGDELDVFTGHGANMAFRRSVLEEIGHFDEALGAGGPLASYEDCDIRIRILMRRHKIIYLPSAIVYHKQTRSWSIVRKVQRSYGIGAGACAWKYLRCGNVFGLGLFARWLLRLGIRELAAGLVLRSLPRIYGGLAQIYFPWVGLLRAIRFRVDRTHIVFLP